MVWRVTITISRVYDDRTAANIGADSITNKVPSAWAIQKEACTKE